MDFVSCDVAIGGDLRMVLRKQVSVAELVVLQKLHQRSSITNIKVIGQVKNFNPVTERERLRALYESSTEEGFHIESLYPGVRPDMPTRLDEVVLVDAEDEQSDRAIEPLEVVMFDGDGKPTAEGRRASSSELEELQRLAAEAEEDAPVGVEQQAADPASEQDAAALAMFE